MFSNIGKTVSLMNDADRQKYGRIYTPLGISYLHLQTLARERDYDGCYLRELRKAEID